MFQIPILAILAICLLKPTTSARLHKIFQFLDAFKSEHNFIGFLHVGVEYAIFLRAPKPHDKYLVYELYEAKNVPDIGSYKPRLLAISKVPVDYIKDQLKIYRSELYRAKYLDENVVPGTRVKTLREWQIERALSFSEGNGVLHEKMPILRSIM